MPSCELELRPPSALIADCRTYRATGRTIGLPALGGCGRAAQPRCRRCGEENPVKRILVLAFLLTVLSVSAFAHGSGARQDARENEVATEAALKTIPLRSGEVMKDVFLVYNPEVGLYRHWDYYKGTSAAEAYVAQHPGARITGHWAIPVPHGAAKEYWRVIDAPMDAQIMRKMEEDRYNSFLAVLPAIVLMVVAGIAALMPVLEDFAGLYAPLVFLGGGAWIMVVAFA